MTDRLQKLLEVADQADQLELEVAAKGLDTAMRAFNSKPGRATREDYDATRQHLAETKERLVAKYFPEEAPAPEGERFKNCKQAHNWLQAQGYKVSNGKFYDDCKAGFPAVHKDKSVSRYQVMQYAQQLDMERRGGLLPSENTDHKDRKEKADADIAEMKAEEMRREQDKEWLHADAAWAAVAGLVGSIRDSITHHGHAGQGEMILAAGGDLSRGPAIVEIFEEIIARAFNEVSAAGKIEGVFEVVE